MNPSRKTGSKTLKRGGFSGAPTNVDAHLAQVLWSQNEGQITEKNVLLVRSAIVVGAVLALIGFILIFSYPVSNGYLFVPVAFVILFTPSGIYAVRAKVQPQFIPGWLVLGSILVYDISTVFVLTTSAGNKTVDLINLLSFFIPIFVLGQSLRTWFTRGDVPSDGKTRGFKLLLGGA